jgi:predicted TPR repeat methyltransferase
MIQRFVHANALDILDLGCGTGLMGEALRPLKRTLIGVDLSAEMLEKARARGIYDRLSRGDLIELLEQQEPAFDLVVAADVFNYLGDLSRVFAGVQTALRTGGLFCFSVEAAEQGDFALRPTSRYVHSADYLRRLAERHQFIVEAIEPQVLRRDLGADVAGHLVVMRLP